MKDTGVYVGSVGVLHYRRNCESPMEGPELGWGLGKPYQGQGLAREGVEAALDWTDTVLDAPRTVCMIDPGNAPSLKLAGRLGYRTYAEAQYNDHTVLLLERHRPG